MLNMISTRIVDSIQKNGLIPKQEAEIYVFGFQTIFLKMLHIATMFLIGLSFHKAQETIVFIVLYSLIRIYAGGFHASSKVCCYLISFVIIVGLLSIISNTHPNAHIQIIGTLISSILISFIAPLGSDNKPLDYLEVKRYKSRVRIILISYIAIAILMYYFKFYDDLLVLSLSLYIELIMLIIRKFQILIYSS